MSKYASTTTGFTCTMNTTAATAQQIICYNAGSAPIGVFRIYEWSCGPAGASADTTYGLAAVRTTTGGTFTNAITPDPLDSKTGASLVLSKCTSSAAATPGVYLGQWGFHMRGGYRWVAIPGGELQVASAANYGIALICTYAQGSDTMGFTVYFEE